MMYVCACYEQLLYHVIRTGYYSFCHPTNSFYFLAGICFGSYQ